MTTTCTNALASLTFNPTGTIMDELQTIGPSDLGKLIGRSTKCIQIDASRRPDTLPPRFVIPGTRKVLWRLVDVRDWMEGLAQVEQAKRQREREFAKKMGLTGHMARAPTPIANKDTARAANAVVAAKKAKA